MRKDANKHTINRRLQRKRAAGILPAVDTQEGPMFIVTRLKKIKSKNGPLPGNKEIDGIDYQNVTFFESEEEALTAGKESLEKWPHSTYLLFALSKVIKKKESPTEILDMLE